LLEQPEIDNNVTAVAIAKNNLVLSIFMGSRSFVLRLARLAIV